MMKMDNILATLFYQRMLAVVVKKFIDREELIAGANVVHVILNQCD